MAAMLQATKHQGHISFAANGRQCMANSYAAIRESYRSSPKNWTVDILDSVLKTGDLVYGHIQEVTSDTATYNMYSDIPEQMENFHYLAKFSVPCSGSIKRQKTEMPFHSLQYALDKLCTNDSKCIFTMGSSVPAYTSAIVQSDNKLYFFDPHSRNEAGMACPDGKATMTVHSTTEALCLFIRQLSDSLHGTSPDTDPFFELVSVTLQPDFEPDLDDKFQGFSEDDDISDGELTCKLYLKMDEHSDPSPVSSPYMSTESDTSSDESDTDESIVINKVDNHDETSTFNHENEMLPIVTDNDQYHDTCNDVFIEPENELECMNTELNDSIAWLESGEPSVKNDVFIHCVEVIDNDDNGLNENEMIDVDFNASEIVIDSDWTAHPLYQDHSTPKAANGLPTSFSDTCMSDEDDIPLALLRKTSLPVTNISTIEEPLQEPTVASVGEEHSYSHIEVEFSPQTTQTSITESENSQTSNNTITDEPLSEITDTINLPQRAKRGRPRKRDTNNKPNVRKRVRDESKWQRNIIKCKKNRGEAYVSHSGTEKRARILKKGCGENCKRHCHQQISQDQREKIFHEFWGTGDINRQNDFLCSTIQIVKKNKITNKRNPSKRQFSRKYFFRVNDDNVKVCSKFYMDTLDITFSKTETALQKGRKYTSKLTGNDDRGKHTNRPNKVSESSINIIKQHINSFPRIESHYCRKNSKKEYLSETLSISKMYNMYVKDCIKNGHCYEKEGMYRKIFNTHFNLSFHKPLKDMCDLCTQYENVSDVEKMQMKETYDRHITNKNLAQEAKENDKYLAQVSATHETACFDLQQVLTLPQGKSSCLYYARRLNNYNLTVYSLGTRKGFSYLWNECVANRGANEIGSCVFKFLETVSAEGVKSVTLYSDNCTGQNRNRFFMCMLWHALNKFSFEKVEHKFLERGHTFNENDSMHSTIETALRKRTVYETTQLATIIEGARIANPYEVTEMTKNDFFDFKDLSTKVRNLDMTSDGEKVRWTQIHLITFKAASPNTVEIMYDYNGLPKFVNLFPITRKKFSPPTLIPWSVNNESPVLDRDKYEGFQRLCEKHVIPKAHHDFYKSLPHKK